MLEFGENFQKYRYMVKELGVVIVAALCALPVNATTYYSQGSGDPNTLSNWDTNTNGGGSAPSGFSTSSDVFVIQSGHTMTTTGTWSLSGSNMKLQIENGGILQANHTVDLTPSSTFQIDNSGTYNHNFSGNEIFDGTESFNATSTVEIQTRPSSTLDQGIAFGNLTFNFTSGGSLRVDNTDNETFTVNGNLSIQNTGGSSNELRFASGSGDNVTVAIAGNLSMTGGRLDFFSASGGTNGIIQVGGNLSLTGGTWDNAGSDNLEFQFTGGSSSDVTFELSNGVTITGSSIDDCDWTVASGKNLTLLSDLEVGAGEVCTINGRLNCSTFTVTDGGTSSTFTLAAAGTLGIGSADGIESSGTGGNIETDTRNYNVAATYVYNGTLAQITGNGLYDETNALTGVVQIANTSAAVTLSEDVSFGDGFNLTVDEGAILDIASGISFEKASGSSASITLNGSTQIAESDGFSTSSTGGTEAFQGFTSCTFGGNGNVTYDAAGNQTITNQFSYGNLTLTASNVSSGSNNKTAAGTLDINGNLSIEGTADFDPSNNQINLAGNWTAASGTDFSEGSGTVVLDGTSTQTFDTDGIETFFNLSKTGSGTTTFSDGLNLSSGGTLTISDGTLDMGNNTLQTTSTNRTLSMSGGTLKLGEVNATNQPNFATVSISDGTINFAAAGAMELNGGETYQNLTFSGSGTKTISSATSDINGTVFITESCTLNVSNSSFGDATTNLTMDGGYLLIDGSGTKPDIAGTYTLTGGSIEFSGSSAMTVRSPKTYFNVVISGTNVSSSAGNYTLADGGSWVINSGAQWSTSARRILTAGTASVTVNGTFSTSDADGFSGGSGTSIDQSITNITLGSASTVAYTSGSAQTVTNNSDYVNLGLSGSGAKTFVGTPEVSGTLSISGGSATLPSALTFDGSSDQTIPGMDYGSTNITLSGGGNKVLGGNTTMNGTITFTSGNIDVGSSTLTLGSSAVVSSANASSYIEISGTGRVSRTISNGSSFTFPIGHNPYLPMTIECASCVSETFEVGVQDVIYDDPEPSDRTTTFAAAGYTNYVNKMWEVTAPAVASNVTFTIQWNNSDQTVDPGSGNSSNNMGFGYWLTGSGAWTAGSITAATVSGNQYSLSRTLSSTSSAIYYMGAGSSNSALPIVLMEFTSKCESNEPVFQWITTTEINNSHFTLQGSHNGTDFENIERIEGAGTSYQTLHYQLRSRATYTYYRLKQTDFDSTNSYSHIIENGCQSQRSILVKNGRLLTHLEEPEPYSIFNLQGQLIASGVLQKGIQSIEVNALGNGVYVLRSPSFNFRFGLQK